MVKDMNFFEVYQGQRKKQKNQNIYVYSLVSFLVIAILGTLAWNNINIIILNNEIASYNEKLTEADIKGKVERWEAINEKNNILSRYESKVNEVNESIESRKIVSTELLDKLSSTLPTEVTFNSISITNTDISIQAISTSRVAIGEIEHNLKSLNNIQDVYIGGISGNGNYSFDIKCILKEVE